MEVRLCSDRNLARDYPRQLARLACKFSFYHLGAHPFIPPPPSKKRLISSHLFKLKPYLVWWGRGGQIASFTIITEELGFNSLDLHCSDFKAIQFSYSYCSNRCLLHIIGCLSSFLLQILSGSLHQHQPLRSSAPSLSCIYLGPWGMFFFQHRGCHIFLLPCAKYWCKPDT